MKQRLSLFIMALLAAAGMQAQMIAYQVTTNVVGDPGEPTVIDLQGTTGKDLSGIMIDADGNMEFNNVEDAKGFPIGFEFRYNSQKMQYFLIGTDLEIQLSPTETISTEAHKNKNLWFTTEGIHDVIGMAPREGSATGSKAARATAHSSSSTRTLTSATAEPGALKAMSAVRRPPSSTACMSRAATSR